MVRFETYFGDESALLGAHQVSGAAYVKVLHGYFESAAEIGKFFNSAQSSSCFGREIGNGRSEQITERFFVGTSHAPTQLVQIAQAEHMRLIDNDGIGIGDVKP